MTMETRTGSGFTLMRRPPNVKTEIRLPIRAYNMNRVMAVLGTKPMMKAISA